MNRIGDTDTAGLMFSLDNRFDKYDGEGVTMEIIDIPFEI
jgi:hypothetical protein